MGGKGVREGRGRNTNPDFRNADSKMLELKFTLIPWLESKS